MPIDVSRSLFIKNDAGEFVPVPMLKGEPGPAGPQGEPGSDANVTFENITNALGYVAADDEFVQENAREINQIKSTLPEVFIAEYGVTPYADVKAAIDAGKAVSVRRVINEKTYSYQYARMSSDNFLYFGHSEEGAQRWAFVTPNSTWSVQEIGKVNSIVSTATNSQYPSAKAVYDFMASPSTMPTLTESEQAAARQRIGASNFSGSYNDLSNKPTIPTNTNQLTNGAGYVKPSDGYEGWRVKGGINSIVNSTTAISINPAINGMGYCRFRYNTDFHLYLNGVEAYLLDSSWDELFDGKSSTYIRFNYDLANDSRNAWDSSELYIVGRVVYKKNSANEYRWYRAIVENTNHAPINEQSDAYWEYLEHSSTSYLNSIDFVKYGITLTLDLDFGASIAWENGLSLYWRAGGQNAAAVKIYKWNYQTNDWHTTTVSAQFEGQETVNTIYLGSIPSVASGNTPISRIKLDITPRGSTWSALCQIAITGLAGGIEGTVLNRGGDTVFGTIYPFKDNTVSLGTSSYQFYRFYTKALQIGNTALDEAKLKKLLALIQ